MKEVVYDHSNRGNAANDVNSDAFYSYYPATGEWGTTPFYKDNSQQIDAKVEAAANAFQEYRQKSGTEKAIFLEAIAGEIEAIGEPLIQICSQETALPEARLQGERARTAGQLRLFASLLREGSWVHAKIDTALPDRIPLPRPDLRQMQRALGPVVVFGASNFPLAFSVAGGDTASALAAGCPVIFKAHEAHPATSHLIATAIEKAARQSGMPDGVFALVYSDGPTGGMQLVKHTLVKAVGFTGSYKVGKLLFDAAAARPEPIPVYAEMGSTNPVFVLPRALKERGEKIAQGFAGSLTMGVGQFCTNPGMLLYPQGENTMFLAAVKKAIGETNGGCMLTPAIHETFSRQVAHLKNEGLVELWAEGKAAGEKGVQPVLFKTDFSTFREAVHLKEEMFGPASILIEGQTKEDLLQAAREMDGHLTATVHGSDEDLKEYSALLQVLEQKVGRVVINGFPTGVEVSHAMVHGGPFPATTDSRSTSVGTSAIYRFTRPVCYQDYPEVLLPDELKKENPLGIQRLVDGEYRR